MLPSLVTPSDLTPFPGAPFDPRLVYAAEVALRAEAGWHIAPVITETVVVRSHGGCELVLPTLQLISVASVTPMAASLLATSFAADLILSEDGILYRAAGWPRSPVSVTMTHGYDTCPAELLPVLAQRAANSRRSADVSSVAIGQVSTSYFQTAAMSDATVSRYSVKVGVA